jgi:hypothetical protein
MPAVLVRSSPAKSAPGEVGQFVAMSESLRVTIVYDETALRHYAAHLDVEWFARKWPKMQRRDESPGPPVGSIGSGGPLAVMRSAFGDMGLKVRPNKLQAG